MSAVRKPSTRDVALAEAKVRADCTSLASMLRLTPRAKGCWVCPCQKPTDREGKLSTVKGTHWKCHKCGKGGDVVNLVMHVEGLGHYDAIGRLCALYGVAIDGKTQSLSDEDVQILISKRAKTQAQHTPPQPEFDAAAWWQSHGVNAAPALALLSKRGIPHADTRTPFVIVTPAARAQLPGKHQPWLQRVTGDIAAAPMRNMRTGNVEGLHLRAIERQADTGDKRRTVNAMTNERGTPRGFGVMADIDDATTVMLCEGVLDVLACEALVHGIKGVAVVGGSGASELPKLAEHLAKAAPLARVVVCWHLDRKETGKQQADKACKAHPNAIGLRWGDIRNALPPVRARFDAMRTQWAQDEGEGFDVCDILTTMHNARTPITTMHGHLAQTRFAFAASCGLQRSTDGPPQ